MLRTLLAHNRYRFVGGEERHVDLLERYLPDAGVEIARFELDSGAIRDSAVGRAKVAAGLAYRPSGGRAIAQAVARTRPDVVHFHNITPLLTPAALRTAKRAGTAVVLTIPNFRFACPSGTLMRNGAPHDDCIRGSSLACGLRRSRGSWGESIAYGLAIEVQRRLGLLHRWVDAIVMPSSFLAERAAASGLPAEKIHVIANGVPPSDVEPAYGGYALYAGRLSAEKGTDVVVDAAGTHGLDLVVAGDGPLRPAVERASNAVRYLGHVDEPRLVELRGGASCAVVPSVGPDVLPFSALEALAAGLPVVASRVGGLPEIVDDGSTGFLVPPRDSQALAEAIAELVRDSAQAAAMGRAARAAAAERFDAATQARKIADLYRSLI